MLYVSSFWPFKHSTYFQFAIISFGFKLIRVLTVTGGWSITIKQTRAITTKKNIFHPGMCDSPSLLFI